VRVVGNLDHDSVLGRCRAAVHHGGAGTTAASLQAGLPTVVCSVFADQPFWGTRVVDNGVGRCCASAS
jgi:UDP:flavonoid glycosyltransferase YjiC (YdhE family)